MKKQVIEQLQNTLEGVMQEWINTKQELAEVRIELEETQEALRRNRNQLESYKMFETMYKSSKITNTALYKSNISYAIENCNYNNMSVWQFIKMKFVKK